MGGWVLKTAWQEHYQRLYLDLPLADMIPACVSFGKRNATSSLVGSSVQIVCCIALARQKGKFKLLQACQPKKHQRRH